MGHDILTLQFGSDRAAVQKIVNGLYIDGHVSIIDIEKELRFGGWGMRYLDLYVEMISNETYERLRREIPAKIRKTTEDDYFRDIDVKKYIDKCIIIEFKTGGSEKYQFNIGRTVRQIKQYQTRTHSMLSIEHRPTVIIPIIMLPDKLYGVPEEEMSMIFKTFTNSNIFYKTYFMRKKDGRYYIAFEDRHGNMSTQTPKDDASKILHHYDKIDILCPSF